MFCTHSRNSSYVSSVLKFPNLEQNATTNVVELDTQPDPTEPNKIQNRRPFKDMKDRSKINRAMSSEDTKWKEEMVKTMETLRNEQIAVRGQSQQLAAKNESLSKEVERLRHLEQVRALPVWSQQLNTSNVSSDHPNSMSNRYKIGCFNCGEPTHFVRSCPLPRQSSRNFQNRGDIGTVTRVSAEQNIPLQVGGVTTKNRRAGGHSTYLKAFLASQDYDCLLDTGSEATIVPSHLVDRNTVRETTHTLKAANGTPIPLLGEVIIPMCVGDFETSLTALVSEHITEVMLGIDWLTENKILWDFDQSRIRIGNKYHKLRTQVNNGQWCRRVTLEEPVSIPPRSEMDISTRVMCRPWKEDKNDVQWSTVPTTIATGVHVSRTVIPGNRLYNIPVRVMNTTKEEVIL